MNQHGLPSRQHAAMGSSRVARGATPHGYHPVSYREQNTIFYTHHNMVGYNCSGIELLKELAFVTHIFGHSLIGPERNASESGCVNQKQPPFFSAGWPSPDGPSRASEPRLGATVHPVLPAGRDQTGERHMSGKKK